MSSNNVIDLEEKRQIARRPDNMPFYCVYHPCIHRWRRSHPGEPPYRTKSSLYLQPTFNRLSEPLIRRVLWEYITFYNVLSPEARERMRQMLLKHGYTDEELMKMLSAEAARLAAIQRRKDAGIYGVLDEDENGAGKGKGKGKKKGGKKKKGKGKKGKGKGKKGKGKGKKGKGKGKKGKGKGKKGKGKGKKGKGKGAKGDDDDDDDGPQVFKTGRPPGPGWPHHIAMEMFSDLLNMMSAPVDESFISRASEYFSVQTNVILDLIYHMFSIYSPEGIPLYIEEKAVILSLNLAVWIAKNVIAPAEAIQNEEVAKLLELKGELPRKAKPKDKKKGKDKKGKKEVTEEVPVEDIDALPTTLQWPEHSDKRGQRLSNDHKKFFLDTAIYYNSKAPEFTYNGRRVQPPVNFSTEGDEELWALEGAPEIGKWPLKPQPIPYSYDNHRPILLNPHGDAESCEPWYIMSDRQAYDQDDNNWKSPAALEQFEMLMDVFHKMMTVSKISMKALLEMLQDFCEAVSCEKVNKENLNLADVLLDDKRTVILQRHFIRIFGRGFRDYDADATNFMNTVSRWAAEQIRLLYGQTGTKLWQLQTFIIRSHDGLESDDTEDDPRDLSAWSDWLDWLLNSAATSRHWADFIRCAKEDLESIISQDSSKHINTFKREVRSKANQFSSKGHMILQSADFYESQAENLVQVNNRPIDPKYFEDRYIPPIDMGSSQDEDDDYDTYVE